MSSKNIGAYIAFTELFVTFKNVNSIFAIILALGLTVSMFKLYNNILDIDNKYNRKKVLLVESCFYLFIFVSSLYFTNIKGSFYSLLILIIEAIIYGLYISPKILDRQLV